MRRPFIVLVLVAAAVLALARPAAAHAAPCGSLAGHPQHVRKVVVIVMENHSFGQLIGPPGSQAFRQSPYLNGTLKAGCGLATAYRALTHPSLPNYIAMVSGSTGGITSDCTLCWADGHSVFGQVHAAERGWRAFQESMPWNCARRNYGRYAKRHNPATYFPGLIGTCRFFDIPMGPFIGGRFARAVRHNWLQALTFVTPNMCNDTHDCPVPVGDAWLRRWIGLLTGSLDYRRGNLAVFLTWDEGYGGLSHVRCLIRPRDPSCHVPALVISPYTRPGSHSALVYSHYSLLRTVEHLLHLPFLGHAGDRSTRPLGAAFGLS